MARRCLFCHGSDLTREHVLPKWLEAVLPGAGAFHFDRARARSRVSIKSWTNRGLDVRVREFCATCNSGWMSALESQAGPILTPCIQGREARLSRADARPVALWAVKTALVYGRACDPPHVPASWWTRSLYKYRNPPRGTHIWLAAYEGDRVAWLRSNELRLSSKAGSYRGEQFTMAIGKLALQVLLLDKKAPRIRITERPGNRRFLRQVWPTPTHAITYPPPAVMADEDLDLFAERFIEDFEDG